MTTAVDTNVIAALWDTDEILNSRVQLTLDEALSRGSLVVAGPVYAELLAFPGRTESFLDAFFADTGILIDWNLNERIWRAAGRAFRGYAIRRKRVRGGAPRRILADFLIGAHAVENGFRLLTLDAGFYPSAFPRLAVLTF